MIPKSVPHFCSLSASMIHFLHSCNWGRGSYKEPNPNTREMVMQILPISLALRATSSWQGCQHWYQRENPALPAPPWNKQTFLLTTDSLPCLDGSLDTCQLLPTFAIFCTRRFFGAMLSVSPQDQSKTRVPLLQAVEVAIALPGKCWTPITRLSSPRACSTVVCYTSLGAVDSKTFHKCHAIGDTLSWPVSPVAFWSSYQPDVSVPVGWYCGTNLHSQLGDALRQPCS